MWGKFIDWLYWNSKRRAFQVNLIVNNDGTCDYYFSPGVTKTEGVRLIRVSADVIEAHG